MKKITKFKGELQISLCSERKSNEINCVWHCLMECTIISKDYKDSFEKKCFRLIIEAYQTSLNEKKFKLDWKENDFSELLNHYINENNFCQKNRIFCKTECRLFKVSIDLEKGYTDKLSRIDFVYSVYTRLDPYQYFMEAKNLKQNGKVGSALKRRYIKTGIDNFVSKKYENGCLVGYVLEGKSEETIIGINSLLEKYKRNNETLIPKTNKLLKTYYESDHSEIGTLKYLILNFTNVSN